ncbi:MAG TPA: nucleoside transporter C-terminal domain-containing protein [Bryobacteraceae bacterium]|jgi:CNT family concentrative nucleoside transporter
MDRYTGLLGLVAILAVAYLFSTDRKAIKLRVFLWGLGLQFVFAFLVLKAPAVATLFEHVSDGVKQLLDYSAEGSKFLFGDKLGVKNDQFGVVFAFQVLPIVIFIVSLFAILYYLGVMQVAVHWMAVAMQKVLGTSGAESTSVAASIFMGQTEAPVTIKPFLEKLTSSELFTIMTSGMAHVSGATMGAYVMIAGVEIRHLLTAVIMTAPATILLSKMFVPETQVPETLGGVKVEVEKPGANIIDAAARGASDGLSLALNIGAMLIAFLSLIALMNGIMGAIHSHIGWFPASMQVIMGKLLAPVAWLLGVRFNDCATIGNLLGERVILNEFVAFLDLGKLKGQLDPKSFTIATYALCGFANLSSIAIQIGGIGALAPSRKSDIAKFGLRAVAAGTMANFMSACIAGVLL